MEKYVSILYCKPEWDNEDLVHRTLINTKIKLDHDMAQDDYENNEYIYGDISYAWVNNAEE